MAVAGDEVAVGGAFGGLAVDDDVAVGHAVDDAELVADEDDGGVGGEVLHDGVDLLLEVAVEVAEGFVEDEEGGAAYEGASEEGALELSAREGADGGVGFILKLYEAEGVVYGLAPGGFVGVDCLFAEEA